MENKIHNAEETTQLDMIGKQIRKIRNTLEIVSLCIFGIVILIGCYYYKLYGLARFREEMFIVVAMAFVGICIFCSSMGDCLEYFYCFYRCKECGHIHRFDLNDFGTAAGFQYCPNCGKHTRHKKMPIKRKKQLPK